MVDLLCLVVSVVCSSALTVLIVRLSLRHYGRRLKGLSGLAAVGAKVAGENSGEARLLKSMERKVLSGAVESLPELQAGIMVLKRFAPDVGEQIEEDPKLGIILCQRLAPVLEGFLKKGEQQETL